MQHRSDYERLSARVDELVSARSTTEDTWQQIADNLLGRRDFTVKATPGRQRMQAIYDDTAKVSSSLLSGAMHSLLTSPSSRWFGLGFEDPRLSEIAEAAIWLEAAEQRLYAAFAAPTANFHAQLSETYIDLINFGTGAIFIDDVPGVGVQFSARPLQELYLAEDPSGRIDTVVRKFRLTARQAVKLWGGAVKIASKAVDSGSTETLHDYIHVILPSDDVASGNLDVSGMPWSSFHLSTEDKAIVSKGGFHEMPIATPRWEKDAGEVYGRGPGWNALSNQKMLNEMKKVTIKAGQKAVDPVYLVDSEGVLPGDLHFHPGGVIPVNSIMASMNPAIQTLGYGGDFNIGVALIEDTRKAVQAGFHHQLIETIRDPRMTATQVLELSAQMQRHLAPILGRMQTEMLEPIIERVFAIEERAGRLPPAPEAIANLKIRIDYVSPVARAQQTSDAKAIMSFTDYIINVSQVNAEIMDIANMDDGARKVGEALGVPKTMLRDSRAVKLRRDAAAQLAAEEQEQQQLIAATDQVAKLAKSMPQQVQAG